VHIVRNGNDTTGLACLPPDGAIDALSGSLLADLCWLTS
jgi:hypothetical protein